MRYLIAGDDVGVAQPGAAAALLRRAPAPLGRRRCATRIAAHPKADFYAALARFTRDFFAVEAQGFDLLDA